MKRPFSLDYHFFWAGTLGFLILLPIVGSEHVNFRLFELGNSLPGYTGDLLWANLTLLGDTLLVLVLLLPFVARKPEFIWSVIVSALIVAVTVHLGKWLIDSPRPAGVLSLDALHTIGYVAQSASMPSGHTAAAFTLAACIAFLNLPNYLKYPAVVLACLVGVSRIAVGIHWPLDVVVGALIGWLGAALGCHIAARMPFGISIRAQKIQAAILVVLAIYTIFLHDGGYPDARWLLVLLPGLLLLLSVRRVIHLFRSSGMDGHVPGP